MTAAAQTPLTGEGRAFAARNHRAAVKASRPFRLGYAAMDEEMRTAAYLGLFDAARGFDPARGFRETTLVYTCVRRQCLRVVRDSRFPRRRLWAWGRRFVVDDEVHPVFASDPAPVEPDRPACLAAILAALDDLDEPARDMVRSRTMGGETLRAVAARHGCSPETVRRVVRDALALLRAHPAAAALDDG